MKILFWIGIVVMACLGLRNIITMIVGESQEGPLMKGQRACHLVMVVIYWGAAIFAIVDASWWPMLIGLAGAFLFRTAVIRSGDAVGAAEEDNQDAPLDNELDLCINGTRFSLGEPFHKDKLLSATCKNAGFLARLAARPMPDEVLYWAKNCTVMCFGEPVVWAKLETTYSNLMCGSSAYLFYAVNGLRKVVFQVFGDVVMVKGDYDTFVELCDHKLGPAQSSSENNSIWYLNRSVLRCQLGGKWKEAWFNWEMK